MTNDNLEIVKKLENHFQVDITNDMLVKFAETKPLKITNGGYMSVEKMIIQPYPVKSDTLNANTSNTKSLEPVVLVPKNDVQRHLAYEAMSGKSLITVLGPAGTGKTLYCVAGALQSFRNSRGRGLTISRPEVGATKDPGALPGGLNAKYIDYLRPIFDKLYKFQQFDLFAQIKDPKKDDSVGFQLLMQYQHSEIEIATFNYLRGRDFEDRDIVLDEAQNTTREEMKLFITRMGKGCRLFICGDLTQIDKRFQDMKNNGLVYALNYAKNHTATNPLPSECKSFKEIKGEGLYNDETAIVTFSSKEIVRSAIAQGAVNFDAKHDDLFEKIISG